jgi:hypothetical protein
MKDRSGSDQMLVDALLVLLPRLPDVPTRGLEAAQELGPESPVF